MKVVGVVWKSLSDSRVLGQAGVIVGDCLPTVIHRIDTVITDTFQQSIDAIIEAISHLANVIPDRISILDMQKSSLRKRQKSSMEFNVTFTIVASVNTSSQTADCAMATFVANLPTQRYWSAVTLTTCTVNNASLCASSPYPQLVYDQTTSQACQSHYTLLLLLLSTALCSVQLVQGQKQA